MLAPFLPPKHEYVLFITLSEVQIKLYQHYLDNYSRRLVLFLSWLYWFFCPKKTNKNKNIQIAVVRPKVHTLFIYINIIIYISAYQFHNQPFLWLVNDVKYVMYWFTDILLNMICIICFKWHFYVKILKVITMINVTFFCIYRPLPGKSSGFLFPDFQSLQRIWTHPLVLKYNSDRYEIMQQKKVYN